MIIIIVRTFVLYFSVLFSLRIMGKAELSKMDPFQMVILFMISELASLPIADPDVSLIHGVSAIATLMFLQILLSIISLKWASFKTLVNGTPSILIDNGKLNKDEMDRLRISVDDLTQQLRLKGYPSISQVNYAIMEINGDLSVIPNANQQPLTPEDISLTKEEDHLPVVLIADGVLYKKNLSRGGFNEASLRKKLSKMKISDPSQVFLAFTDEQQTLTVYPAQPKGRLLSPKGGDR